MKLEFKPRMGEGQQTNHQTGGRRTQNVQVKLEISVHPTLVVEVTSTCKSRHISSRSGDKNQPFATRLLICRLLMGCVYVGRWTMAIAPSKVAETGVEGMFLFSFSNCFRPNAPLDGRLSCRVAPNAQKSTVWKFAFEAFVPNSILEARMVIPNFGPNFRPRRAFLIS